MTGSIEAWTKFFAHALDSRLPAAKLAKFAVLHSQKFPLAPRRVADILLRPRGDSSCGDALDPLVPLYIAVLLREDGLLDMTGVLRGLLRYSTFRPVNHDIDGGVVHASGQAGKDKKKNDDTLRWKKSYIEDEAILYGLAKDVSSGARPRRIEDTIGMLRALMEWMKVLAMAENADNMLQQMGSAGHDRQAEAMSVRIALGTLLFAAVENQKVVEVLRQSFPKDVIKSLSNTLSLFTPLLLQSSSMIAERLELFRNQTLLPLEPVDKKAQDAVNEKIDGMMQSMDILAMDSIPVVDVPVVNTRAGLYIYLQSLLVGRPLIDDNSIFNYLHNRYQGDLQNTCIDLIMAGFDVLANSTFRNEDAQTTILLRSFLINKVPVLLASLSASIFPPLNIEFCITEALNHVDINIFPTFSSMFDDTNAGNDPFSSSSVRQDFCFACCLHGLIQEQSIEVLLGEVPMQTLPAAGRYLKEDLVQQCLSDPERAETLIEDLEQMDGNVGAASQAITEMIRHYCQTKETMSLKSLCSLLARKPSSMDIMLLFDQPVKLLQPVCELLDNWRHDEDLGEYQPVYEEFGSILLLVLAFVHRYNLSSVDLGIHSTDSFISKLLVRGSLARYMDELAEQEKGYLDVWIRGLFNAEGAGLGDEPMSACPPQDFYLLMPTLMQQIVIARSSEHLSEDILKGGLEFLVDTFLLPSLVGALSWLASHLWSAHNDSTTIVSILQILISPSSISSEASSMLSSILNITAAPLESSLRYLQRSEPTRQDVEPLSRILKPHLSFSRTAGADHTELEAWTGAAGGGITVSIRNTIHGLMTWPLNLAANMDSTPYSYTHRQFLAVLKIIGAKRLLQAIRSELMAQIGRDNLTAPIAFDVAVALICTPDASSVDGTSHHLMNLLDDPAAGTNSPPLQRRLTLRDALRTAAEEAPKLHKTDPLAAEATINLYRRVEAQMAVPIHATNLDVANLGQGHDALSGEALMAGAQAIDDAMVAAGVEQQMMDVMGVSGEGMMDTTGMHDSDLFGDMSL